MTIIAIAMNHPVDSELFKATSTLEYGAIGPRFLEIILFESSLTLFSLGLASSLLLECAGGTVLLESPALNRIYRRLNSCFDLGLAEWLDDFLSGFFQVEWRVLVVTLQENFVDGEIS